MIGPPPFSLPLIIEATKKRKVVEDPTPEIKAIDLDDFKFVEVFLRDVMVLNTPVTYFAEGIFGWLELKRDLDHYFESNAERTKVIEACKLEGVSNEELMADHIIKVLSLVEEGELSLRTYKRKVHASLLKIAKYQKVVEDTDAFFAKYSEDFKNGGKFIGQE